MRLLLLLVSLVTGSCATTQNLCSIEESLDSGWTLVSRNIDSSLLDLRGVNDRAQVALDNIQSAQRLDLFVNSHEQFVLCRIAPNIGHCGESAVGIKQTPSGKYVLNNDVMGWITVC